MFMLALALFWPLLQLAPQNSPMVAPYKELSSRWDAAGAIETGLTRMAVVVVCPSDAPDGGQLIVADSSGQIVEMRHGPEGWTKVRSFGIGEPITVACAGAPHLDRKWRLYAGTQSGKVLELTRAGLGWTTKEVRTIVAPVTGITASEPGQAGISQLFVIDGDGRALNLWLTEADQWVTRLLPEIDGGATEVCYDAGRSGLIAILAGPKGTIHKFYQDSTGSWTGTAWATLPAGPLDMASSADPTMKDIAVYYSGDDGIFRYLFYDYTDDEKARIPIAEAADHLIGKGTQRRFNEFFAMSAGDFCLFEFNFTTRQWDRIPMEKMPATVVSTAFGPGRGEDLHQIYVATIDGKIHEYVRQKLEPESE
jgi:hypothetical protein